MSTLSKNDDWTELDEQFRNLMQEMMEESSDFYDEPQKQVDYSFLDNKVPFDEQFFGVNSYKRKGGKSFHFFVSRIAIIVLGILITGSGIAIWINSQPANALKFQVEKKFYEVKDGVFITDEKNQNTEDAYISNKYDSLEDIELAQKFMPTLLVPSYITPDYEFKVLKIDKDSNQQFTAEYTYLNGKNKLFISIINIGDETKLENIASGEIIEQNGQKFCVWKDTSADKYGCTFIKDNLGIFILGEVPQEEMLKIAGGLQ
ncbi:MAG: DUF4367 domain-containing protein [Aminipila sp.]